jgi:large subunit ribosomal protein L30
MIVAIRISGMVNVKEKAQETLSRLRLRRKYSCVIVNDKPEIRGMINASRNFIAYGKIDEATLIALLKARGKKLGDSKAKLENPEKLAKEILAGKSFEKLGIKPFFRLHPARGGIKNIKLHYPRGVLGDNKEAINKLILRML